MSWRKTALVAAAVLLAGQADSESRPRIAIIIDDLGYHLAAGKRAIALPGPVTFAVLPETPRGSELARLAHENGKDVLLHLPLEAVNHIGAAEPGGMVLDMSRENFRATFASAIAAVPHAIGVSSHRGSLLTRHPGHMAWLMKEIRTREDLFFIDSYTTHHSIALKLAAEEGVPATKRDVFLDHERSVEAVERELERLKAKARKRGHAIAIGHPFPETLEVLERELPLLEEQGFDLVRISDLLHAEWNRI
ncbi:MAG: divergent polysaccharide deacetylase family protein [Woeseiaceae bacterium]|nr:divergent polysaccharide deacetylase family protein [Woeseiaceae bacterium]NIP20672.1 divergent polysaccharide deacetylase family protein [Woeseiaceae bacterium]NIS89465.1 divergent polysaccharide deacetylase family protein [Woeseiaceae bacterium]